MNMTKCDRIPHIGLASGIGGGNPGSGKGPLRLQEELSDCCWEAMISLDPAIEDRLDQIAHMNEQLAEATFKAAKENPSVVVLGGDHSCAVGTWSGISEAKRIKGEEMALLWFDAHMDSHTLETSESGNPHGMPLAALLGHGSSKLTEILSSSPKLKPENVFLIGIRSYEEPERKLLEKLNVRVYYIEEVQKRGLKEVVSEILHSLASRRIPYGISLDIDFFDPEIMRATGTPEKMGVDPEEFLQHHLLFQKYPPFAFEFVEYNPSLDSDGLSLHYIKKILEAMKQLLPE